MLLIAYVTIPLPENLDASHYSNISMYTDVTDVKPCKHPSIFYTRLIQQSGRGGSGAYPSGHLARGGDPTNKLLYYISHLAKSLNIHTLELKMYSFYNQAKSTY